jgi:hypothetical protein
VGTPDPAPQMYFPQQIPVKLGYMVQVPLRGMVLFYVSYPPVSWRATFGCPYGTNGCGVSRMSEDKRSRRDWR